MLCIIVGICRIPTDTYFVGICRRNVVNPRNNKKYSVEFIVFEDNFTPPLGLKPSKQMSLVNTCESNFERVYNVNVEDNFNDLMEGKLGTLSDLQHLKVDDNVQPFIMPDCRVPISLRPKLKSELERLASLGVIAPVEEPTP